MKILVVGAEGQVGREFVELTNRSVEVNTVSPLEVVGFGKSELDITSVEQVLNAFDKEEPDLILNAAAYTAVDKAEDDRAAAFAVNCNGPMNLAVACERFAIPLIHISTDYVFDGGKGSAYVESDVTNPLGVYGESKLAGENAIRESLEHYYILRTSWVFGKYGSNFVKTMRRLAKNQPTIRVVADQFGSPTSAVQIAETLLEIANRCNASNPMPSGIYHFGGLPHLSWYEFALEILSDLAEGGEFSYKKAYPISTNEYPTRAVRPNNTCLNNTKLESVLGELNNSDWRKYLQTLKNEL